MHVHREYAHVFCAAVIERSMSTCSASVLGGDLDVCVDADKRETADSCSLGASGG